MNAVNSSTSPDSAGISSKIGRYLITSVINVGVHQGLLQLALAQTDWSGEWCNAFAAAVAAVPAFLLSRYWVWQVKGKADLMTEIVPFWVIALAGLVVSSAMAGYADRQVDSDLIVSAASMVGYLFVWIAKFAILNFLFARSAAKLEGENAAPTSPTGDDLAASAR